MLKLFEYFKLDERVKELFDRMRAELISSDKFEVWAHTLRVIKNLYLIREIIDFNFKTALIAAICHDIGYNEVIKGHEKASALLIKQMLDQRFNHKMVSEIIHCIESHEAEKGLKPQTNEAIALHDADIMDYCGEWGIIKAFRLGKDLGLSNSQVCKRVINVIEEGFLNKKLKEKYGQELMNTEEFFLNVTKDLNKERSDFKKYGMKNV